LYPVRYLQYTHSLLKLFAEIIVEYRTSQRSPEAHVL
jgi:hypothetical protein